MELLNQIFKEGCACFTHWNTNDGIYIWMAVVKVQFKKKMVLYKIPFLN
jgi:hypothetical protein